MANSIMVLGTMSNVGKSVIAAGLCRVFAEDGYRTAPFKSQNMALNSFVTRDGLEIGRAQAMQAQCAKKEPDIRMNPILLKPNGHNGSEVVLMGKPVGNMDAKTYYKYKKELHPLVLDAFHSLSCENDVVVVEGAGSPAEINLNRDDFVNLGLAAGTKTPCLLVGDIDRGGVFAQIYGTLALLKEEERRWIKGLIINKFRGDLDILLPGLKQLEDLTGLPVLGVVPYTPLQLDEEDSQSGLLDSRKKGAGVDIAVIRYPSMANYTDFHLLQQIKGVSLRYVTDTGDFGTPHMVILPGSKNTVGDLIWLKETGWFDVILAYAGEGGVLLGICGGFQMLGQALYGDLHENGAEKGLGLLPCVTRFSREKERRLVTGIIRDREGVFQSREPLRIQGYEIHMGQTELMEDGKPFTLLQQEGQNSAPYYDGCIKGNVYGTYVHGILDQAEVVNGMLGNICTLRQLPLPDVCREGWQEIREKQYGRLAGILRESLDMEKLYEILRTDWDDKYEGYEPRGN